MTQRLLKILPFLFFCINKVVFCTSYGSFNDTRIVGGSPVPISSAPYQVWLLIGGFGCGGSIINTRTILTAAHCIHGHQSGTARIGTANSNSGGSVYEIRNFVEHPQYNREDYDVGTVKTDRDMSLDGVNARAVRLAQTGSETPVGTQLFVTGFGRTSENGPSSEKLLGVRVPVSSHQACIKAYEPIGIKVTSRMICASESGKDSCNGDSGGPAISQSTGELVGIVSFGQGCADPRYPGVYAKVADPSIRQFIQQNSGV